MAMEIENMPENHITKAIRDDLEHGRFETVHTRFAPEPNAYIHIGSAISGFMTYDSAEAFNGIYNLRFDDTNPNTEKSEFVDSIREDLRWLGYDWQDREFFASDYFDQLYDWALQLICDGKAYVCNLSDEQVREYRGTNTFDEAGRRMTPPGKESPNRDRPISESLELFAGMKAGEYPDGSRTLRAKIDMAHDNLLMRDPVMYRITHTRHHRTGKTWCIYPTYDWAHGLSDSIEGITHSICGLEFRAHRELYDWFLDQLGIYHPRQIEYTRINLTYTVTGKRYLKQIVENGYVDGWDDPRLPTISALRRRGIPAEVVRTFCSRLSIADRKIESTVDIQFFDHIAREYLNRHCPRAMGVIRPLKIVITNYPESAEEMVTAINNPEDSSAGTRKMPFCRELYIEREDFMAEPIKGFYRLSPGKEVRLRYAYFITCQEMITNRDGDLVELRCTYDPATKGGDSPDGRKVKSTLHWVSARHGIPAEFRLYNHLFTKEDPFDTLNGEDWLSHINRESAEFVTGRVEPSVSGSKPGHRLQFERLGYFCVDRDTTTEKLVFNRTLTLRDSWLRKQKLKAKIDGE
jgi:glutaminyl-tRNA synthetase